MATEPAPAPVEWANYQPEFKAVGALIPYARNARTHSPAQVKQIAASMLEFGVTGPILADKTGIVAGHGRVMGAELVYSQGLTLKAPSGLPIPPGTLPVLDCQGWSQAQRKAYILADNQLAQNAGWDEDLLSLELADLEADGFDLALIGFDGDALDKLLGTGPGAEGENTEAAKATLAGKFMLPPFSILNAREGWWQERKRAWLALGIQSEIGRGQNAAPAVNVVPGGGNPMPADRAKGAKRANATVSGAPLPATNYKTRARGDGRGRAIPKTEAK